VTAALCARWQPGVTLLPMTDSRVETHVVVDNPESGRREAIHFQEWWIKHRAELHAYAIVPVGAETARPAPGVAEAIEAADIVVLPPSNPVVSIGSILSVPGIKDALRAAAAPVVGVSPIVGGAPVRGMADACLTAIGVETSAAAVGRHYGSRDDDGILDGWLVAPDETDLAVPGVTVRAVPLLMTDAETTAALARIALDLAHDVRAAGRA